MRFLNFGSINIDYVYHVDHFVRPGETELSEGERGTFSGGKGFNQSVALAKAGAEVYHAGKISREDSFLLKELESAGVRTDFIQQVGMYTGHAIIQVDTTGQNCILLSAGANHTMTETFIDEVLGHFGAGDVLLLQNEINRIDSIIEKAHARGMTIVLNPSPINKPLLSYPLDKVTCFLLNEIEGQELTGRSAPAQILERMQIQFPGCAVVLTLGKDGVCYWDGKERGRHGIYDVEVVDTTAAGDTFTGYFLACRYQHQETIARALEKASIASSLAVSKNGAAASIPLLADVHAYQDKLPYILPNV